MLERSSSSLSLDLPSMIAIGTAGHIFDTAEREVHVVVYVTLERAVGPGPLQVCLPLLTHARRFRCGHQCRQVRRGFDEVQFLGDHLFVIGIDT